MRSSSWNRRLRSKSFTLLLISITIVALLYFINKLLDTFISDNNSDLLDRKLQSLYKNQSRYRQHLLGLYLNNLTAPKDFGPFYNALVPEIVCPWLARVGNVDDGGKWTCNPWALPPNCIIYSLGVGRDITFETHMDAVVEQRCKIYSFDNNPTLGQAIVNLKSERILFTPVLISTKTNDTLNHKTIADIMKQFNHEFIDFFKVDIEKSEFDVLPSLLGDINKPIACQIFIEMHGTPHQCAKLHSQLGKAGFYLFFYEQNGYYPELAEYSFMHESCFERYGVTNVLSRNFPI